jgi:DNA-binding CsgD family transcriptional regulator
MPGPTAFAGREAELSRLLVALGGDARLILVVGDAGVGKTRLVGEGVTQAARMVCLRGECLPLAGALPLLPVAAALGELARLDGGGLLEGSLNATPEYVRAEVGRLLPGLGPGGGPGPDGQDEGWRRERLFTAVAELLNATAAKSGFRIGLIVEDVQWADSATLDCLTFLAAWQRGAVSVVATCRADEAPMTAHAADWLALVRGTAGVEEIRLGPLSRSEAADQVTALAAGPVPPQVVDELYARAQGNPFFTEQLVVAAQAAAADGRLRPPAGLPGRLAELLSARAGRCAGDARAVLMGLAVAGRPLPEDLLGAITGLDAERVRRGLRELAAARLLADDLDGRTHRPRHALLAEAVAGGLLPGERAALHERTARALAATGDKKLAAEVAGHWRAADNPAEELPTRVAAAEAAEQVFGWAEAGAHWRRAIELCQAQPDAASAARTGVPGLYLRAIDALHWCGDSEQVGALTDEAYHRFADHPDPATAAAVQYRAGRYRAIDMRNTERPLIEAALRLYEQAPPLADHVRALLDYAESVLADGQPGSVSPVLERALRVAEAAGATALIPSVMASIAEDSFRRGQVDEAFAVLERGWALARAEDDGIALLRLAVTESDALLKLARFDSAAEAALRGFDATRRAGLEACLPATVLACNASEALLGGGRTAEAAALIEPLTTGPPDRLHWIRHEARAEIDLLLGNMAAAVERRQQIDALFEDMSHIEFARESAQRAAELALWAERPGDALAGVRRVLRLFHGTDMTIYCGRLLTTGLRACADLAERARARRDEPAAADAAAAADTLAAWVGQVSGAPFAEHPFVATASAERAMWDAEQTRLAGASDPEAWNRAASAWQELGCPHRAGYAWWRQAQAQLDGGQPAAAATAALRAAAAACDGHAPLLDQVHALAKRARLPLQPRLAAFTGPPQPAEAQASYGLTARELAVLRLLVAGRTNAQIGAELYISPKTASVHVTSILRKLGVSGRVQAAALAERARLLPPDDHRDGLH